MLIKFQSEGSAPFQMLHEHAMPLLSLMGQGESVEGSISGAALPAALASLEAGLARMESKQENEPGSEQESAADEDGEDEEVPVQPGARAAPLKKMLNHAIRNDTYVMWRPA